MVAFQSVSGRQEVGLTVSAQRQAQHGFTTKRSVQRKIIVPAGQDKKTVAYRQNTHQKQTMATKTNDSNTTSSSPT
ncbi:hypothetical protein OO184_24690 [Photorhabdus sp. APURE]|uniref:hypothetical protein n=1 Tax=Photorhabdus aballayi TaxID=2991723 RepID=UPI00223D5258|nr:hypothetical protein [Photorhabdus aballayi]MCW7551020.1 hypothetical protein [Photorhabdus aballayi]